MQSAQSGRRGLLGRPCGAFVYIIPFIALMYMSAVRYTLAMTAPKIEHQERIADVRNSLAEAINRARYRDETTVLTHRSKRVAALVSMDFYERALAALGEERVLAEEPTPNS